MLMMANYLTLILGVIVGLVLVVKQAHSGPFDAVNPPQIDTPSLPDVPQPNMPQMPDMPTSPSLPGLDNIPGADGLKDTIDYIKMMEKIVNAIKKINDVLGKIGLKLPTPDLETIKSLAQLG